MDGNSSIAAAKAAVLMIDLEAEFEVDEQ